jgi:hypothetical protein
MLAAVAIVAAAMVSLPPATIAQPERTEGGAGAPAAPTGSDLQSVAPPRGGALEVERDPGRGPRPHEPVFLEPAATTTEHTRLGLSSWIAPGAPAEHRENPGGLAIGFTISWPAPSRDAPSAPSAGPSAWRGSAAR